MMSIKIFNVSFPTDLAKQIDQKAKEQFGSRSDFLRYAALRYLRDEKEFEELLAYGKELGQKAGYGSEEEVAADITKQRKQNRRWR